MAERSRTGRRTEDARRREAYEAVRLGTWISNTRSRRAKLTDQQHEQLTALGIDWATAT
ncbi:Helicase associated domain protein [Streptomyces parvus]|uniref:Helicase associated domain protein n=1 Tax=Streptomyces parvus TaxID=66428 RepID=UPI00382DC68A